MGKVIKLQERNWELEATMTEFNDELFIYIGSSEGIPPKYDEVTQFINKRGEWEKVWISKQHLKVGIDDEYIPFPEILNTNLWIWKLEDEGRAVHLYITPDGRKRKVTSEDLENAIKVITNIQKFELYEKIPN